MPSYTVCVIREGSITVEGAKSEDEAWNMVDDMNPNNFDWGEVKKTLVIPEE